MSRTPRWTGWVAALLLAAGLYALYRDALGTGFLNDDYLFLESARTESLARSLTRLDALGNYYRPLSRQIYFAVLGPLSGGHPLAFHLVNFAIFLGALALLADLLAVFVAGLPLLVGLLWFAVLPMQRVNLMWVSCSQDLMALFFALAAIALWRREKRVGAMAAYLAAIASKESALPLPLALVAWDLVVAKRDWRDAARRQLPMLAIAAAWAAVVFWVRSRSANQLVLYPGTDGIAATFFHMAQSFLGVEHPAGWFGAFGRGVPPILPIVLVMAAGLELGRNARADTPTSAPSPLPAKGAIGFALTWVAAFTLVTWPVVHTWSGYYYTLAACGGALLLALAARGVRAWGWAVIVFALMVWHMVGTGTRAFAIENKPWGWTSHLTTFYFSRGASLASAMGRDIQKLEPSPPRGTRFFFATLPPWAGFQMGNGALLRTLYRDPSLQSHFYSRFSDTTAADAPCRFYHWDGATLAPLYPGETEPFFQVGCDLLLLDRPDGAAHAFRRALAAGGAREDNLYWLGWACLMAGDRAGTEAAWREFGARDDSLAFGGHMVAVRSALYETRDTLTARRRVFEAIRTGIGLPHPHAILGELLIARGGVDLKYGLLELKGATWLNPRDLLARRELIEGFIAIRMDDAAREALGSLRRDLPPGAPDSALVALERVLERRRARAGDVADFE